MSAWRLKFFLYALTFLCGSFHFALSLLMLLLQTLSTLLNNKPLGQVSRRK